MQMKVLKCRRSVSCGRNNTYNSNNSTIGCAEMSDIFRIIVSLLQIRYKGTVYHYNKQLMSVCRAIISTNDEL